MNPHKPQSISPVSLFKSLWINRKLIMQMAWREVIGKYKGSMIGLLWSFIHPILMLAVYTFVFSVVFKAKWGLDGNESKTSFALLLFVGMIIHGLLAEVLNQAPRLILNNTNYVKKVIFPLEILPVITLAAALFHTLTSIFVLLVAFVAMNGYVPLTSAFLPLVLFPLIILTLGIAWIIASLGVFLRDIGQIIGIVTTVMLFMAPVFFPLSAMPVAYHPYIMANPLTFIIEQARQVLIFGVHPDWVGLGYYLLMATSIMWLGYTWFQKTRKGFADVL